jgi:hypothetical protein
MANDYIPQSDSATKKRGKPHGIHGAEIRWGMLAQSPASVIVKLKLYEKVDKKSIDKI